MATATAGPPIGSMRAVESFLISSYICPKLPTDDSSAHHQNTHSCTVEIVHSKGAPTRRVRAEAGPRVGGRVPAARSARNADASGVADGRSTLEYVEMRGAAGISTTVRRRQGARAMPSRTIESRRKCKVADGELRRRECMLILSEREPQGRRCDAGRRIDRASRLIVDTNGPICTRIKVAKLVEFIYRVVSAFATSG